MNDPIPAPAASFLEHFPQWDRYVLLLGAGASKDAGFPIVRDFSDPEYLNRLGERLRTLGVGSGRPDLLEVCTKIRDSGTGFEQLLAAYYRDGDIKSYDELIDYYQLLFLLSETIAGMDVDPTTGQLTLTYYLVLGSILRHVPMPVIITFNHDLSVELGMERRVHYGSIESRMDFINPPLAEVVSTGFRDTSNRIPLLKLHGSLGFLHCQQCNHFIVGEDNLWFWKGLTVCRRCGGKLMPSYVPPLEEKDPNLYLESWNDARAALRQADLLLVIGYSLPEYDLAARTLLGGLNPDAMIYIVDPYYEQVRRKYEFLTARMLTGAPVAASRFIMQWANDPSVLRAHW